MRMLTGSPDWRNVTSPGFAAAVLIAIGVLSYRLIFAPFHGVHSAAECAQAYAEARTRQDSVSVDFLSLPDPAGRPVDQRCGYLRATTADRSR